jgi:hypothetical protein
MREEIKAFLPLGTAGWRSSTSPYLNGGSHTSKLRSSAAFFHAGAVTRLPLDPELEALLTD